MGGGKNPTYPLIFSKMFLFLCSVGAGAVSFKIKIYTNIPSLCDYPVYIECVIICYSLNRVSNKLHPFIQPFLDLNIMIFTDLGHNIECTLVTQADVQWL